jgi:NADPH:quinone reductase-like Zn-dependent oxidoreductase
MFDVPHLRTTCVERRLTTMMLMRVARIHTYGDAGVFVYEDNPCSKAREGKVPTKIHATTVNRFDGAELAGTSGKKQ